MSEKMLTLSFRELLSRALAEYKREGTVFGVGAKYVAPGKTLPLFGGEIETPFGPAAGPHTQLSQNLLVSYFAGARFFELKTVQKMDGEELSACIARPCIKADDEGYNCEWSTELTVPQAMEEYIHGYVAIKVLSKLWGLGDPDGFVFNMSVGYDLAGIQTPKLDAFIEGLKDASGTPAFPNAIATAKELLPELGAYIDAIDPHVCRSVTISTLHGCPPQEIESIATYLIKEKKLYTLVKCNPTLLGYDFARKRLDEAGFDYLSFDRHHFEEDLQYRDAVPMFRRLIALAKENGVEFGVKLSNTFPVEVKAGELPSEEMYMSGKSLYLLTVEMAARLSKEFAGQLRISYSGGADYYHLMPLFEAGIWPITMATTLLKPGGYERFKQMAEAMKQAAYAPFTGVDADKVAELSAIAPEDKLLTKELKPLPRRSIGKELPLLSCFTAPCKEGCPIRQDIPQYLRLLEQGEQEEALRLITQRNALPAITGKICAHPCMDKCTRHFYERPVQIRDSKYCAVEGGYEALILNPPKKEALTAAKVAVIGGGPAGLAAAYYLGRAGAKVTVYEKEKTLGGVVRNVIPSFRIPTEDIEKDIALVKTMGGEFVLGQAAPALEQLEQDYDYIVLAAGANKSTLLDIGAPELNAIAFLKSCKRGDIPVLGEQVVVIGGGNTAMDTARQAKRCPGVKEVSIVYRRNKKYMPADVEEMELAIAEGVHFRELLSPADYRNGQLICDIMELGEADASGRRSPVKTGKQSSIPCSALLTALGEKVDTDFLLSYGVEASKGRARLENGKVFVIGDLRRGPATVVEAMADAMAVRDAIVGKAHSYTVAKEAELPREEARARKSKLDACSKEFKRCLGCQSLCENCVSVCPNRANVAIRVPGLDMPQILHLDYPCNECGNCAAFCPYEGAPYKDKFTYFRDEQAMEESHNQGFVILSREEKRFRIRLEGQVFDCELTKSNPLNKELELLLLTFIKDYSYLIKE